MKRCFTFTFLLMILTSNLAAFSSVRTVCQTEISDEEYAVYSAVINKMFADGKVTFDTQEQVKLLVITDHTISLLRASHLEKQDWASLKQRLPEELWEIINDFAVKNKEPKQLKDNFKVELKRTLIKKDEIEQMSKGEENAWKRFYKSFPNSGGYIGFSRIGFDTEKKQAVVYMEHNCHELCASGHFLLLKKTEEGWRVIKDVAGWIS